MVDQGNLVDEFAQLTITTKDQARVSLEKANWDLRVILANKISQLAVARYQNDGKGLPGNNTYGLISSSDASEIKPIPKALASNPKHTSNAPRATTLSNIRTLNDVVSRDTRNSDQTQALFAGDEKSGMLMQGPSNQGKSQRLVEEILKKAVGGTTTEEVSNGRHSKSSYFTGSGHTLGSEEDAPVTVNDNGVTASLEGSMKPVTRQLTFWRNGFSVDAGPLLRYDNPANSAMLNAINSGRAPLSLLNVKHGQPVDVNVSKRQDEDYVLPPKAPPKSFEGNGNRLGSAETTSSPSISGAADAMPGISEVLKIDASQPTTSIQIRLSGGSR